VPVVEVENWNGLGFSSADKLHPRFGLKISDCATYLAVFGVFSHNKP